MKDREIIATNISKGDTPFEVVYKAITKNILNNCSKEHMVDTIDYLKGIYSSEAGDIVQNVLSTPNPQHQGNNVLHYAALSGCSQLIEPLVNAGTNVDSRNERGQTPLHLVARRSGDNSEAIKELIKKGADTKSECFGHHNPLYYCWRVRGDGSRSFNEGNAMEILCHGMDADKKQELKDDENNPMHVAVKNNDSNAVKNIIDGGVNAEELEDMIFDSNKTGFTPIDLAVRKTEPDEQIMQKYMIRAVNSIMEVGLKHYPEIFLYNDNELPTLKDIRRKEKNSYYYPAFKHKPLLSGKELPETDDEKVSVIKQMLHAEQDSQDIRDRLAPLIKESLGQDLTRDVVDYIACAGMGACNPYDNPGKEKFLKVMLPKGDSVFKARLDTRSSLGVYTHKNTLFVGRNIEDGPAQEAASPTKQQEDKDRAVYGTIVHEGAHALCHAMYGHTQVYPKDDQTRKQETHELLEKVQSEAEAFEKVASTKNEKYISSKMNNYFSKKSRSYKKDSSKIAELATAIVTVAIKCGYDETQEVLSNHFPEYNKFWHDTFLKDAKKYMEDVRGKHSSPPVNDNNKQNHTTNKRQKILDGKTPKDSEGWTQRITDTSERQIGF